MAQQRSESPGDIDFEKIPVSCGAPRNYILQICPEIHVTVIVSSIIVSESLIKSFTRVYVCVCVCVCVCALVSIYIMYVCEVVYMYVCVCVQLHARQVSWFLLSFCPWGLEVESKVKFTQYIAYKQVHNYH